MTGTDGYFSYKLKRPGRGRFSLFKGELNAGGSAVSQVIVMSAAVVDLTSLIR
jgi:hypothetical protein